MDKYSESKKARRIAAVVYLLIMGFIFAGTYISNQQKEATRSQQSQAEQEFNP